MSIETMEALLLNRTETDAVPGLSVSVVKADRLVWARGFGFADLATAHPATPQTSYLWFSMTKIVTATAVISSDPELSLTNRWNGAKSPLWAPR